MASEPGEPDWETLSPEEAFAVLGNETRIDIIRSLGAADGPVPFSDLRDRVGVADSGQFNYHLDKLESHLVRKTDSGYALRQAGHRIREAILSGAVTETGVIEPTRRAVACPYCGAPIEISYREERLPIRWTACVGAYSGQKATSEAFGTLPDGAITLLYLPSAAFRGRSAMELLEVAHSWTYIELTAMADGLCLRCTGRVDLSVAVCPDHQPGDGICGRCAVRFGGISEHRCRNCGHTKRGTFVHHLFGDPEFRAFFESRGIDPLAPSWTRCRRSITSRRRCSRWTRSRSDSPSRWRTTS